MNNTASSQPTWRYATLAAALAMAMGLAACNKNDDRTAGQRLDSAIDKTEQAAQDAKARTEAAAQEAKVKMDQAAAEARAKGSEIAQDTKEAARDASAATREAAGNAGEVLDDAAITARIKTSLAADTDLSAMKIDVDTKNNVVTLTGPVKSEQVRDRATQMALKVNGVTNVVNNLVVTPGA